MSRSKSMPRRSAHISGWNPGPARVAIMVFLAFLSIPTAFLAAQNNAVPGYEEAARGILSKAVARLEIPEGMGGISVLVRSPKGEYFASSLPDATPDLHFRAASVTKVTTAAAIMLLHERGLLNIDDLVTARIPGKDSPYLPETPDFAVPYKDKITIRQLLQHRAGVWDVGNDVVPEGLPVPYAGSDYVTWTIARNPTYTFTIDELVGVAARSGLSYGPPPADYHYTNTGYSMLGKIIERVSGMALDEFLYRGFTKPLGLNETYFIISGTDRMPRAPWLPGYSSAGGESAETTEDNASYAHAEGNMVSTFRELATLIRAIVRGEAGIGPASAARMREMLPTRPGRDSGYGLGLNNTPKGLGFGHDGGIAGYLTVVRHEPESDFTLVMVCSHLNFDDLAGLQSTLYETALSIKDVYK